MKRLNLLLTLLSLNAVIVIIERLSPTTLIFVQPYNFLRLHEVVQMLLVIPLSFIISFFLLQVLSDNFRLLKTSYGMLLGSIFTVGLYLTATGNGGHEIAGFIFNTFCNKKIGTYPLCGSAFFNDYYFGNIVYFLGLLLSNTVFMVFERHIDPGVWKKRDTIIVGINGFLYGLTLFAYAAFDVVLVGFGFILVMAVISDLLLFAKPKKQKMLPFTLYSAIAYSLSLIATVLVRFH